jgi:xanthine dehydrogenase accessory factor
LGSPEQIREYIFMKNIYLQYLALREQYNSLAVATVTGTKGSTPQKPGSSALIGPGGLEAGTVGGGVTEGRVMEYAAEALASGVSGLFEFDLTNDISNKYEAICGGMISILIDADPETSKDVFETMKSSLQQNIPGVLVTEVLKIRDAGINIKRYWFDGRAAGNSVSSETGTAALRLIGEADPRGFTRIDGDNGETVAFLQPFFPPERLIIAGAGHIGRSLAHIGALLDFDVTIADDREEYANKNNIPDADHFVVKDIGEAVSELAEGPNTYVVIVTRGHKDDALALRPCIGRDLTYTGMIGSRTKIAAIKKEFLDNGWATLSQWKKIHTPIGLSIGSQTVEEIAVSIAAELVAVRRKVLI